MGKVYRRLLLSTVAASTVIIAAPTVSFAAEAEAAGPNQVEEVIVTATRRSTKLLETPVSVSSVSGQTMAERNLSNLQDLTTQVPGVQFAAANTNTYVTIRGIGNGTSLQGADPGVAFHLDGVYLASTGLAAGAYLDVDHVEIVRGPQGTLFGRNATGGTVNVISKVPTETFQGAVGASVGVEPSQVHADGFLSGPLNQGGTLLGRLSARTDYNEGYTKNLTAGGPKRLDGQNSYGARGQLVAKPNERFTAGLSVDYYGADDDGQATFLFGAPGVASGQTIILTPAQVAAADAVKMGVPSATAGDLNDRKAQNNQSLHKGNFLGVRGTMEWRGEAGTLRLLAATDHTNLHTLADGDGTNIDFTSTSYQEHNNQQFGELLYTSKAGEKVEFVLGANLFRQISKELVVVPINSLHLAVIEPSKMDTQSHAVFGHVDLHLTDRATVFGGVRYTKDTKNMFESNNFVNGGTPLDHGDSWSKATYEAGLTYRLADDVNAFVKYSTGFKGGGFAAASLAPPFRPETDTSYEAGVKGLFLDRRLQAELTAFHMDYNDLQVNQVIGAVAAIKNAAKAKIDGAEASIVALLTPTLRAELTAAYLDARFTEFLTADSARPSLGTLDLSGNALPWSPKFSTSLGLYDKIPLSDGGSVTLGARYYWKSRAYFTEFNLPIAKQDAVGRADLSINYVSASGLWEAGVYGRNITDEVVVQRGRVVSALLNSASLGTLDSGRDIGVSLRRRF